MAINSVARRAALAPAQLEQLREAEAVTRELEPTEPERLYGPHGVELPCFDDDWFRFFHQPDDRDDVRFYEVHEMCRAASCSFRPGTWCPFHPIGCECSFGACQDDDDELVTHRMRREHLG